MYLLRLAIPLLLTIAACGVAEPDPTCPTSDRGVLASENAQGNITFVFSNQALNKTPVHVTIELDGHAIIDGDFAACNQHEFVHYQFQWAQGDHVLKAISADGNAEHSETIVVGDEHLWGFVSYWFEEAEAKGTFHFKFQNSQIGFQ